MRQSEVDLASFAKKSAAAVGQTLAEFTRQSAREMGFPDIRSFLESNIRTVFPKMPSARVAKLARLVERDHLELAMATLPPFRGPQEYARSVVDDQRTFLRRIDRSSSSQAKSRGYCSALPIARRQPA